jgi:hypothetical protein
VKPVSVTATKAGPATITIRPTKTGLTELERKGKLEAFKHVGARLRLK